MQVEIFSVLRRAWMYLRDKNVSLARTRHRDLFTGERDVLAVTIPHPYELPKIFRDLVHEFPMWIITTQTFHLL